MAAVEPSAGTTSTPSEQRHAISAVTSMISGGMGSG